MFGNHVHKQLSAYLHGELSSEDARRVAEHLHDCQRCRAEFAEVEFGAQLAGQLKREQAPGDLWAELELAISTHPRDAKNAETAPSRNYLALLPLGVSAACALVLIGIGLYWRSQGYIAPEIDNRPSWEVTRLDGRPVIGKQRIAEKGKLPLGEWLTTDETSRAQISVGQIGEVKIEPNSSVRLVETLEDNHRLAMARGKMEAFIWAPPRKFFCRNSVGAGRGFGMQLHAGSRRRRNFAVARDDGLGGV